MNNASVTEAAIDIPKQIRDLLDAPNYVHLSTVRRNGAPRNWIVWVGLEGENVLICTDDRNWKAKDLQRDPRVGLSVADHANPYRMATLSGRVVEMRPDRDCEYMDPIAVKYTSEPFPNRYRGPNRVCFVIAIENAHQRTLDLVHNPAAADKTGSAA